MPHLTKSRLLMLVVNKPRQRSLLQKGFTLVELMIVVVIVGILSAIALPNFLNQQSKAKAVCAETQVSALAKEQQIFFAENSVFAGRLGTGTGELDRTPDTACNGYTDITLSDTKIQAEPISPNGFCVTANLNSTTGSYELKKNKGLCQ